MPYLVVYALVLALVWLLYVRRQRRIQREHARQLRESLEAGLARVFTLHAEGRCVAFNVGFVLGDAIRMPYLAHDATMPGSYSVGLINNLLAIEHCLQSGLKEFDLTRGSEGYKSLLGGEARHHGRAFGLGFARIRVVLADVRGHGGLPGGADHGAGGGLV